MKKKTLLLIGGGEEHRIGIKTAHELGLLVFNTDGNPDAPAFADSDFHAVVSTYDEKATLSAAQEHIGNGGKINGIMTMASDVPYTVAYVAEKLGLPGIGTTAAKNVREKLLMKERFKKANVPIPKFCPVHSSAVLSTVARDFGYPFIIKPVDSRGARGVQKMTLGTDFKQAFQRAKQYSPTGRVMAEEYFDGPQLSTEGFIIDGKAYIPAIFDRNYEYLEKFAPFIVENGGEMPSKFADRYRQDIIRVMQEAALALGIATGVIKGDLVIHNNQIKVIEIAGRFSGGWFGTVATPVSTGIDILALNIKMALGENPTADDFLPRAKKGAAIRFAFPEPGKITEIKNIEKIMKNKICKYFFMSAKPGDIIEPITNHPGRPAVVVADGKDAREAAQNASRLINMLEFIMEEEAN